MARLAPAIILMVMDVNHGNKKAKFIDHWRDLRPHFVHALVDVDTERTGDIVRKEKVHTAQDVAGYDSTLKNSVLDGVVAVDEPVIAESSCQQL
jgi:hypothetical protein